MNICIFSYQCASIILLLGFHTSGFLHEQEFYEGSQCQTEHGLSGVCKKLPECPSRLKEALQGKRGGNALGRCGFDGFMEIVCCPEETISGKFNIRPAELACHEFENETTSEITSNHTETSASVVDANDERVVNPFILNGTRAAAGEFPYMAALGYENIDEESPDSVIYNCGGAVISTKWILTAAHCVNNINNLVPKWAKLASVDVRSTAGLKLSLGEIIAHPEYRRSRNYNDIAVVSLQSGLRDLVSVRPICLQTKPLQPSDIKSNTSFVVIGFGGTETKERSEKLMKSANLNIIQPRECNASYTFSSKLPHGIDNTLICAMDSDTTRRSEACHGDSGGPLVMISGKDHTVIGITSFGQGCGSMEPGGYTAVSAYIDWIESKVWPNKGKS